MPPQTRQILKKPGGAGIAALDNSDSDDRTITENSEDQDAYMNDPTASGMYNQRNQKYNGNENHGYKAIRTVDNMYRNENLNPIYSTQMDKEDRSEGEIPYKQYDSNYEDNDFEDPDDCDDDF